MKLIEKLKGAHERPYVAYKVVGYYASYNEAKEALCNVHTLEDVYRSWLELHSLNVSPHTMKGYECAYHHVSCIINISPPYQRNHIYGVAKYNIGYVKERTLLFLM